MSTVELEPGTILSGTYRVVRRIGAGGMGAVYEARHLRLGERRVAIKVLLRELASEPEAFARFRREADIGARLGHPNIVSVTDWAELPDGSPFLVMDYLEGEDLAERLSHSVIDRAQAFSILRQVGAALTAAHRQGIVHRDLKPHNIFLVPVESPSGGVDLHVKVLDFGISKIAHARTQLTQESVLLGTPQYMSPEQALGRPEEIDPRTDQFALAAIAYEMLAGRPAFAASAVTAVIYQIVHENPTPLAQLAPDLPEPVARAVERGLSKEPGSRFPDVGAFVQAVCGEALDSAGLTERRPPPTTPTVPMAPLASQPLATGDTPAPTLSGETTRRSRRRLGIITMFGGLVVLTVSSILIFLGRGPSDLPAPSTVASPAPVLLPPPAPPTPPAAAPPSLPPTAPPAPPTATTAAALPRSASTPPVAVTLGPAAPDPGATDRPASARPAPETRPPAAEPPAAAAKLDDAETLLGEGHYHEALRRAQQSLPLGKTPRAYRIMTLAYCGLHDLGGVQASLTHVAQAERGQVLRRCRQLGMEL